MLLGRVAKGIYILIMPGLQQDPGHQVGCDKLDLLQEHQNSPRDTAALVPKREPSIDGNASCLACSATPKKQKQSRTAEWIGQIVLGSSCRTAMLRCCRPIWLWETSRKCPCPSKLLNTARIPTESSLNETRPRYRDASHHIVDTGTMNVTKFSR